MLKDLLKLNGAQKLTRKELSNLLGSINNTFPKCCLAQICDPRPECRGKQCGCT